jgi:hypothetical protein
LSAGTALSARDEPRPRHQLLTFTSLWRRTETMLFYGVAVLLIGELVTYLDSHKLESQFLVLAVLSLISAAWFHLGSRRHYVQVTPDGLRLNTLRRHELIPFQEIRQARTQLLQALFAAPSRRPLLQRSLRQFERTPACVIRLELAPAQVARLGRAAGRGCAVDQDLILVVSDAKALEDELQTRIRRRPPAPASRRR